MRKFFKFLPWILALIFILLFLYFLQKHQSRYINLSSSQPKSPQVTNALKVLKTAKVTRVTDGDTIEIDGKTKVRYIGIDSPEFGNCFADKSKAINENLVFGKDIQIETDIQEFDKYKRLLAYVYVDNIMVNQKLIETGYAKLLTIPPDVKYVEEFKKAQANAQKEKIGLWQENICL